jgi:nitrite reductase/ring-hydroxylating ferredoxin subunit
MTADQDTLAIEIDPSAPVGTVERASVGDAPVAVIRHAEGWAVVADRCPHAGCAFTRKGEVVDGTTLICNCHGSEFDLRTGAVLLEPAEEPLTLFPVRRLTPHLVVVDLGLV